MAVYIVFDVETPNRANDRMSAIGISAIKDGKRFAANTSVSELKKWVESLGV